VLIRLADSAPPSRHGHQLTPGEAWTRIKDDCIALKPLLLECLKAHPSKSDRVCLRIRNGTEVHFDSVVTSGMDFGSLPPHFESRYLKPGNLVYAYGRVDATSAQGGFAVAPIDFMGEQPLGEGYWTWTLVLPGNDPSRGRLMNIELSKDSTPGRKVRCPSFVPAPFDAKRAREQMAVAAVDGSTCGQLGPTRGAGAVHIAFEPSGRVANVTHLNPDFVGTSVGLCVMQVFERIQILPFRGRPQTLTGTFVIQ
jgi:hypothetical protein